MRRGTLTLAGAALALGSMHLFEKRGIDDGAAPSSFALLRLLVALAVVGSLWIAVRPRGGRVLREPRALARLALVGVLASGLALWLSILALVTTQASHKGVIQALYPAATVGFVWILYGRRPSRGVLMALGLVAVGLVLLTSRGFAGAPTVGDLYLLLTVPMIGFTDAYAERVMQGVSALTLTCGRYVFGALAIAAVVLLFPGPLTGTPTRAWPWAAAAGAAAALGVLGLYAGIARAGPTRGALMVAAAPLVTMLGEGLWLGTWVDAFGLVGALLVLAGVAWIASHRPEAA